MTHALSAHDRRVLLAGATAVALIVGGSRLGARAVAWSTGARTAAASLVAELEKEKESIRARSPTQDSLVARRVRLAASDSAILDGESPPLAGASLAELLSDAAAATRVQIGSLQVRTDSTTRGTFMPVQVQASITGELAAVVRFLSRIESGPELLALRELDLSASVDETSSLAKREVIRAELLVEGLARNPRRRSSGNGGRGQ
jgi:hypothetical protein